MRTAVYWRYQLSGSDTLLMETGRDFALYFTHSGSVGLDLTDAPGTFNVKPISVSEEGKTRTTSE